MDLKRTSFCIVLGFAAGCTAYPTLKSLPVDCTVENRYEFQTVDTFETVGPASGAGIWMSGDTVTADISAEVDPLDVPRCGSTAALVLRSVHNNDWGSLFGDYAFPGPVGRDESMYEGLSFWARAPGNTTKNFTILLGDPNTNCLGTADTMTGVCPSPPGSYCKTYATPDAGTGAPTGTLYDPSTGMAISGTTTASPPADACGNGYSAVGVVTTDWQLYTIPFGNFQQGTMPNRVPNAVLTKVGNVPGTGLLTSALLVFTLRMPKEANMELWIDNLGFYRKKGLADGNDGGADAR
jgi:hypothetical protein